MAQWKSAGTRGRGIPVYMSQMRDVSENGSGVSLRLSEDGMDCRRSGSQHGQTWYVACNPPSSELRLDRREPYLRV